MLWGGVYPSPYPSPGTPNPAGQGCPGSLGRLINAQGPRGRGFRVFRARVLVPLGASWALQGVPTRIRRPPTGVREPPGINFGPIWVPFLSFFGSFLALVLRLFSDASSGLLFSSFVCSSASCAALAVLRVSAKNDDPLMEFWLFSHVRLCARGAKTRQAKRRQHVQKLTRPRLHKSVF